MEIYRTWKDYYQSEQDYYLDEDNCADDDVNMELENCYIMGMSGIDTYEVWNKDYELIGIYVGSLEDVVAAVEADKIINRNGHIFDMSYWDAIVNMMDKDLMFSLQDDRGSYQEVFSAYEMAHEEKFGEEWELSKSNPTW